jgi:hypothetical protein
MPCLQFFEAIAHRQVEGTIFHLFRGGYQHKTEEGIYRRLQAMQT